MSTPRTGTYARRELIPAPKPDTPKLVKFTTMEDDIVLEQMAELKKNSRPSDILHLLLNGVTQTEIERQVGIPYHTISSTTYRLRKTFGVADTCQLVCLLLPAMIRKECQDEINAVATPAAPAL